MTLDPEICWRAWTARDARFVGRFVMGVTSTHIYCRPGCPARLPARRNVRFYATPVCESTSGGKISMAKSEGAERRTRGRKRARRMDATLPRSIVRVDAVVRRFL